MRPRPGDDAPALYFGGRILDARRAAGRGGRSRGREAVLVRGGTIEAVGSPRALRARGGRRVRLVDLEGGTLMPGFTDAHIHLTTWVRSGREPWLEGQDVKALERAVARRLEATPQDEWLLVRGFQPRAWSNPARVRATLDRVAPARPLVVQAVDGHSVWANGPALTRAGITEDTPCPQGGILERDGSGALTGVLYENAANLVRRAIPSVESPTEELAAAVRAAHRLGITGAHDFDRAHSWRAAQDLDRAGRLPFRLLLSIPVTALDAAVELGLRTGAGSRRVRIGPVKMFADGTLGSATAWLAEPYESQEGRGVEVTSASDLARHCALAASAGLSVAIHAIGDGAVGNALDALERTREAGLRFPGPARLEHVQLARSEDFARFRKLDALASVQPVHMVSDRDTARRLWGRRTERAYAWRSLARAGATLLFGSDAPFDRAGPIAAIQAAVLRRLGDDPPERVFHPEQRLSLAGALRAHLETPHRAAGWPFAIGRIEPGYAADLVHIDHDLLALPVTGWHRARVRAVWVDGARVFGRVTEARRLPQSD